MKLNITNEPNEINVYAFIFFTFYFLLFKDQRLFLETKVSAWGGYVFIINLIPLHVFVLVLMGRFSNRIYVAYNTFFIVGLLCSMQIPFVGFQPVKTSEHMASAGT